MSTGLATLAGIGQGLMQGSQFVQHQNLQNARLGMLEEQQGWARQDREAQQAEQQRMAQMAQLHRQAWQEAGPEADPLEVGSMVFRRAVQSGFAKPEEIEQLSGQVQQLRQRGILKAVRTGDLNALSDVFSREFGRPVQVRIGMGDDGFGGRAPVYSVVGQDNRPLMQMTAPQVGALLGLDELMAEQERAAGIAGKQATAEKDRAAASKYRAEAGNVGREKQGDITFAEYQKLSPEERAAYGEFKGAGKGSGESLTSDAKNARYMVQVGLAETEAEAFQVLRDDSNMRHILALMAQNPRAAADPQRAYREAESLVKGGRTPRAPASTGGSAPSGRDYSDLWK